MLVTREKVQEFISQFNIKYTNEQPGVKSTGVDLSKMLGGKIKILGEKVVKIGEKVVKIHHCTRAFLNYWGDVLRLPPKPTPIIKRKCGNTIKDYNKILIPMNGCQWTVTWINIFIYNRKADKDRLFGPAHTQEPLWEVTGPIYFKISTFIHPHFKARKVINFEMHL